MSTLLPFLGNLIPVVIVISINEIISGNVRVDCQYDYGHKKGQDGYEINPKDDTFLLS